MKTTDTRRLNQQTQYELRKQAVRLKEKGELDNRAISEIVGLCPTYISTIWKKYQRGVALRPSSPEFAAAGMATNAN